MRVPEVDNYHFHRQISASGSDQRRMTDAWHWGEHFQTLEAARYSQAFQDEYKKLRAFIDKFVHDNPNPTDKVCNIAVHCQHGRHKSVSWAVLMHNVLANEGYKTTWPVHLCQPVWPDNTCTTCKACLRGGDYCGKQVWLRGL